MPLTFDEYLAGKRKPVTFDAFMAKKADTVAAEPQVPGIPVAPQEQPQRLSERIPFLTPTPNPEERILTQLLNLGKGAGQLVTELPQFFVKDLPEALAATITRSGEPGIGTMAKEMTKDTAKVIAATAMRQLNPEEYERWKQTPEGQEVVKMIYEEPLRSLMAPLIFGGAARGLAKRVGKAPTPRPKVEPAAIEPGLIPKERIPTERVPIVEEILGVEKAKPIKPTIKPVVTEEIVKPKVEPKVIARKAKKEFGITEDPNEAGYILQSGEMLDFSGRHYASGYKNKKPLPGQPDYLRGQRNVDHRELPSDILFGKELGGSEAMMRFESEANAIRISLTGGDQLSVTLVRGQKITPRQWSQLAEIKKDYRAETYYDIYDAKGNRIEGASGQAKSIAELKRAFEKTKPKTSEQLIDIYEKQKKHMLRRGKLPPGVELDPLKYKNKSEYYNYISDEIDRLSAKPAPSPRGVKPAVEVTKRDVKALPSERGAVLDIPRAIARPAGAEPVKYKEAIKTPDRPEMTNMESYYKSISTQEKLTPDQAVRAGIALRQTPTGKIKPAVREAGTFVPSEFAVYENFKDAKPGIGGGTKDWIRYVQEIDGALSLQKKAKLPGQAGPAEKYILRRTEDMVKIELDWSAEQSLRIKEITEGLSQKQERLVTEVLEETSRPGSYVETADFATNARIKKITTDTKIVKAAQESRKALEHWFAQQNKLRGLRGQELINYREYYAPHILRETSLWERAFGGQPKAREVVKGPQLPDYIKPNKPFNPRELAREIGLKDYMREMRISKILEDYANTASRDIHHTSIIQNNKALIQQLETMGYKNAAEGVGNFTAESFGGVKARLDRAFDFPMKVQKGMRFWRGSLMRSVFPLNWTWNTTVQTLSSGLTVMRTGVTNSTRGLVDWFANPTMRNRIKSSYSYRVKSRRGGRITRQDVNTGVTEMVSGKRSAWQASIDGANYMTELVERELTGWSIASGLRHGAKRGLKGKALWDYASDTGAKTQSMYNLENKPGILRSETVQTAAPFQTFIFEMYNTAKELAGKTGTPPGAMTERIGWVLRFTAAAYAGNEMAHAITGRRPWEVYSFIPFSDQTIKPVIDALRGKPMDIARGRGLPSFVGAGIEFANAVRSYIGTGNIRKLRNWGLKYGTAFMKIPGGTQIARMVDGWIAVANEGMKDASGKTLFRIRDPWEKARAIAMGPWRTKAGIKYWDKRKTNILQDLGIMEKPKKKKKTRSILSKLSVF